MKIATKITTNNKNKEGKYKEALKMMGYTAGAGAFILFFRWMQLMLNFDDAGLNTSGFWNAWVIIAMLGFAALFQLFIRDYRKRERFISKRFSTAFHAEGKIYTAIRWLCCLITCAGGLLILSKAEEATYIVFDVGFGGLGLLTGLVYPLITGRANNSSDEGKGMRFLSFIPILFFAWWVITIYRYNALNANRWEFIPVLILSMSGMLCWLRLSSWHYGVPDPDAAMFLCMLTAMLSFMCIPGEKPFGQTLLIAGTGLMELFNVWVLALNMKKKKLRVNIDDQPSDDEDDGGFVTLN